MNFINLLEEYSGALTFVVTFIYVIATIFICIANIKSANASKMQADEMQKQFEFSKRLESMPFIQLEISDNTHSSNCFEVELPMCNDYGKDFIYKVLKIKNLGNGTATNITYKWIFKDSNILLVDYPPFNAIMRGDEYYLQLILNYENIAKETTGELELQYNDLLGNTYEQNSIFYFEDFYLTRIENSTPNYLGTVKYSQYISSKTME